MTLLYFGADPAFAAELQARFPAANVIVAGRSAAAGDLLAATNAETTVFLDLDPAAPVLDQVNDVRAAGPATPLVIVSRLCGDAMTAMGLARLHNAEAFFLKPVQDWNSVAEVVRSAQQRIHRWTALLASVECQEALFAG